METRKIVLALTSIVLATGIALSIYAQPEIAESPTVDASVTLLEVKEAWVVSEKAKIRAEYALLRGLQQIMSANKVKLEQHDKVLSRRDSFHSAKQALRGELPELAPFESLITSVTLSDLTSGTLLADRFPYPKK